MAALQRAPQVVIAVVTHPVFGEWLWLMDPVGGPRSYHASWWATEPPSEEQLAEAQEERQKRADAEELFRFTTPVVPLPVFAPVALVKPLH
jgi:hypothetical protein